MKGKILYDNVTWLGDSYQRGLIDPNTGSLPGDLIESNYNELHSHYFLILNSDPRIFERIKQNTFPQLEAIAESTILGKGKNCEFWRVSSPRKNTLYRQKIFKGEWKKDPSLHEKKQQAIYNLIQRAEVGQI